MTRHGRPPRDANALALIAHRFMTIIKKNYSFASLFCVDFSVGGVVCSTSTDTTISLPQQLDLTLW